MSDLIDFETKKDQRVLQAIDADENAWNMFRDKLFTSMMASKQSDRQLVTAVLNALLETLDYGAKQPFSLNERKALIIDVLRWFA